MTETSLVFPKTKQYLKRIDFESGSSKLLAVTIILQNTKHILVRIICETTPNQFCKNKTPTTTEVCFEVKIENTTYRDINFSNAMCFSKTFKDRDDERSTIDIGFIASVSDSVEIEDFESIDIFWLLDNYLGDLNSAETTKAAAEYFKKSFTLKDTEKDIVIQIVTNEYFVVILRETQE